MTRVDVDPRLPQKERTLHGVGNNGLNCLSLEPNTAVVLHRMERIIGSVRRHCNDKFVRFREEIVGIKGLVDKEKLISELSAQKAQARVGEGVAQIQARVGEGVAQIQARVGEGLSQILENSAKDITQANITPIEARPDYFARLERIEERLVPRINNGRRLNLVNGLLDAIPYNPNLEVRIMQVRSAARSHFREATRGVMDPPDFEAISGATTKEMQRVMDGVQDRVGYAARPLIPERPTKKQIEGAWEFLWEIHDRTQGMIGKGFVRIRKEKRKVLVELKDFAVSRWPKENLAGLNPEEVLCRIQQEITAKLILLARNTSDKEEYDELLRCLNSEAIREIYGRFDIPFGGFGL